MTSNTLQKEIEIAVPLLLKTARELSWNHISDNCKFILTEIRNSADNFEVLRRLRKKENDTKVPVTFAEIMPALEALYHNLYDINLHVYRAKRKLTVIDIRYYSKTSLDPDYLQKVLQDPPMLHCRVAQPPWMMDEVVKFDINWEHKPWLISWKLFWARRKLKRKKWLV